MGVKWEKAHKSFLLVFYHVPFTYLYFIFPFLAHALGTIVGALIAGRIATTHKMKFSLAIGGLFLLGGIMVNFMLPGPSWFAVVDILIAYIPMAWIGGKLAKKLTQ